MTHMFVLPSIYSVLPFGILLLMIATGPVLYPNFWHRYYKSIALTLAAGVVGYYLFGLGDSVHPVEALAEYIQFIMLISALYIVSGNILIQLHCAAKPIYNLAILWTGAILANLIGTTGASMLLIRPYMRLNAKRLAPYHIVFFIFMVSNLGGALTPIGDPPLFLGFLKGIPFFWTLKHCFWPWLLALGLLSGAFYRIEYNQKPSQPHTTHTSTKNWIEVQGLKHFLLFFVIIGAVFLDPHKWKALPCITYQGHQFSYIRELILLGIIGCAYKAANPKVLQANQFSFAPLEEVIFIFIGIFGTMMPALALIGHVAEQKAEWINPNTLYWGTGILSSVLDNAPTYLNFLAAGMSSHGLAIHKLADVILYTQHHAAALQAVSIAAVFFGAMTYVGNGPNFMVRAIAEAQGVKMPSFGGYVGRYGLSLLLPVLGVIWICFVQK